MKSSLFLMEQLFVILVFSICAAVCVNIFASSFIMARSSRDINNSLIIAEHGAESYKAAAGDAEKAAFLLGGSAGDSIITVYYDENRRVCGEGQAAYVMSITEAAGAPAALVFGDISVEKAGGEQIIAFTAAARRGTE